jgi:hypothetical protein
MTAFADVERLLERVFERTTARLFRSRVQVVQLERRVERAMERARSGGGARVAVPARYRVRLHPSELADVASRSGGAAVISGRLADGALRFARAHDYHLSSRPEVWLVADPVVDRGQVEVDVLAAATPLAPAAVEAEAQAGLGPPPPAGPRSIAPDAGLPRSGAGVRGDGSDTRVFRRPAPQAARAMLRVTMRSGAERTVEVDGAPLTIGRSADNVLVLADGRVSRHHGRLQARRGTLVYTDLSSTNGSRVNGIRVDEIVLGAGDRIQLGDTVIVVETLPG